MADMRLPEAVGSEAAHSADSLRVHDQSHAQVGRVGSGRMPPGAGLHNRLWCHPALLFGLVAQKPPTLNRLIGFLVRLRLPGKQRI